MRESSGNEDSNNDAKFSRAESGESTQQTCPICGQEYVHKREESTIGGIDKLRRDYSECRRGHPVENKEIVYVHDTQRTVVSRVERSGSDSPSLFDAIRGVAT